MIMARQSIADFTGLYSVAKTLRFELKPVGKTTENCEKLQEFLTKDERRSKSYVIVKRLIDIIHKNIIQESLEGAELDWGKLADAINSGDSDKRKTIEAQQIKAVAKLLSGSIDYKCVFSEKLITGMLPNLIANFSEKDAEKFLSDLSDYDYDANKGNAKERLKRYVDDFHNFSCYFTGFHENRKNIYSDEAITTGAANRVVCQNFPKFLTNIKIFDTIRTIAPEIIRNTESELSAYLQGRSLSSVFTVEAYNDFIHQKGIDIYNTTLGGVSEGTRKLRGLNEFVNLYLQQHKELKGKRLKMLPLFKQILSDRESFSLVISALSSDYDLIEAVKCFNSEANIEETVHVLNCLLTSQNNFDRSQIWVNGADLANLSHKATGNWQSFSDILIEKEIENMPNITEDQKEKKEKEIAKKKFAVSEIDGGDWFSEYLQSFKDVSSLFFTCSNQCKVLFYAPEKVRFRENEDQATILKNYLDSVMDTLHFIKPFICEDVTDCDTSFYDTVQKCYERLEVIIPLYNKARNFVTQKPFSTDKIKLKFDNPTLADGWDNNKIRDNTAFLLKKDGLYYVAIMNPKNRLSEKDLKNVQGGEWQRINYKLLPGPNKMLPKVFFSEKGKAKFKPSLELLDAYDKGKHKKGATFDKKWMCKLIDFFKTNIPKYEGWDIFDFHFSPTESYEDISGFYNEVANGGYKIWFTSLANNDIEKWQEEGKIFLFQLYNKDFSGESFGKKNLHTLYWEAIFDEENLKNCVFKLNGQAEFFFRPKSIENPFSHKAGTARVSKRDTNGSPIPDEIYLELVQFANGKKSQDSLSDGAKSYIESKTVVIKKFDRSVTKDKRYTQNKYFFHVPLTINFGVKDTNNINGEVNKFLRGNQSINIIGIDRGERNLLYYSVINKSGKIIEQGSLNEVNNFDYQKKLDAMEHKRQEARKNWKEIGTIKETKSGYLSGVVHKLASLIVKHNAILVMEDLNSEFKRSRTKIEKQVYQKFEKALIDKLNYLAFKDREKFEGAGIMQGLQLTNKFESFQKLGRQNGFIFYVPAAYTSVTDPRTGFASLFRFGGYNTQKKAKEFMKKVDSLHYSKEKDMFVFSIDYGKFGENASHQKKWQIWTAGERIEHKVKDGHHTKHTVSPTEKMKTILDGVGIEYENGEDILPRLLSCNESTVSDVFWIFRLTVQLRNSNSETGEDYIQSPVMASDGTFFNSNSADSSLPLDADANGAYNIARRGILLLQGLDESSDGKLDYTKCRQSNKDWFEFAQSENTH